MFEMDKYIAKHLGERYMAYADLQLRAMIAVYRIHSNTNTKIPTNHVDVTMCCDFIGMEVGDACS